jgi:hypothetical protein
MTCKWNLKGNLCEALLQRPSNPPLGGRLLPFHPAHLIILLSAVLDIVPSKGYK